MEAALFYQFYYIHFLFVFLTKEKKTKMKKYKKINIEFVKYVVISYIHKI